MEEQEFGFDIDGRKYAVPTFETFTMDEAQVLYDYSGLAVEDFASAHPESSEEEQQQHERDIDEKAKNPAFKRALVHIAYARGNPDLTFSRVKEVVGKANMVEMILGLVDEGDASPPETTGSPSEPESASVSSPLSPSTSSGSPSPNGSAEPADLLEPTGITRSVTSSPVSARET